MTKKKPKGLVRHSLRADNFDVPSLCGGPTLEGVQALAQKQFVSPYGIASYYAVIGDSDRALDWLEKAYSGRDGTLVWLNVHPRLDGLARAAAVSRSACAE